VKKLIALLLAVVFITAAVGCGGTPTSKASTSPASGAPAKP
jgi:hypothetical protein